MRFTTASFSTSCRAMAEWVGVTKLTVVAVLLVVPLAWLASDWCVGQQPSRAPFAVGRPVQDGKLITHASTLPNGGQQLMVVDTARTTVCVYHVDAASGQLALKSVRNIGWDLQMTEFNGVRPLPQEVRSLVEDQ